MDRSSSLITRKQGFVQKLLQIFAMAVSLFVSTAWAAQSVPQPDWGVVSGGALVTSATLEGLIGPAAAAYNAAFTGSCSNPAASYIQQATGNGYVDAPQALNFYGATYGRSFVHLEIANVPCPINCPGCTLYSLYSNDEAGKSCPSISVTPQTSVIQFEPGSRKCVCPPNSTFRSEVMDCRPTVEIDLTRRPKQCPSNSGVGKPIFPATGEESYSVPLLSILQDFPLKLTYSSNKMLNGAGEDRSGRDAPSFGELWYSSVHRRMTFSGGGTVQLAQISRGDGSLLTLRQTGSQGYLGVNDLATRMLSISNAYRLWDRMEGVIEEYTTDGMLQTAASIDGRRLTYTYSTSATPLSVAPGPNYLIQVADSFGRTVNFSYGASKVVQSIADSTGRTINLSYSNGNLTSLDWPSGVSLQFLYENPGLSWALTGVVDEEGQRFATVGYAPSGTATSSRIGSVPGFQVSYATEPAVQFLNEQYTPDDPIFGFRGYVTRTKAVGIPAGTVLTTPSGSAVPLNFGGVAGSSGLTGRAQPAGAGCAASSTAMAYDANGNLASHDDFNGYRVCYSNDANRNLETARVEGLNAGNSCTGVVGVGATLPAGSRKISTQWHPEWRKPSMVAEPGRIVSYVYNGQADPLTGYTTYCSSGTLPDGKPIVVLCRQVEQATTDTTGAAGFSASIDISAPLKDRKWTYNQFGQVLTSVDALNRVTTYSYYQDTAFSGADPFAVGHTAGDVMSVTNAVGHATQYLKYNKYGQWLQMQDPNGVVTNRIFDIQQRLSTTQVGNESTVYEYFPTGLLKKVTQADMSFVGYEYDDAHRNRAIYDNFGNRIEYTLDNFGNRLNERVTDPGNVLRRQLSRSIDALGRVEKVTGRE